MKRMMLGTAAAAVLSTASPEPAGANPGRPAYFVIIENGGTVQNRDAAKETASYLLGELVELRRRRATRDASIHLIFTANPTAISWSGTPQQLYEQGEPVLDLLEYSDTCSDLVLAFDEVRLAMDITRPSEVSLITIGPMIHAGFPCDGEGATISLPQPVPEESELGSIAAEASFLRHVNVHEDQDEVYFEFYRDLGIAPLLNAGVVDLDIMSEARTRAVLGHVLGGR